MASSSSSSSSCSSFTTPWKYDVFLSFRGSDARTNFVDHLDNALRRRGIMVFKDDLELERGKHNSVILTAIEESRFSLIVFSENYASSPWCLNELVKIYECCCKEGVRRQTAFPIFYRVSSSEVQEQTGKYEKAFLDHEGQFRDKIDQVHRWKKAMTELANFSGWELKDRGEVDFIGEVVDHIDRKLRKSNLFSSIDAGDYIGMDSHLEKLSPLLKTVEESNDVRFIGICGMGGVGKSTLAKFIYSKMSCQFDGSGFLENIRVVEAKEGGLAGLQSQLLIQVLGIDKNKIHVWSSHEGIRDIKMRLSRKKVLVILDNVDHLNQLKSLAGSSHWFGSGSRIIITTRDEHLLECHGVGNIYRMLELGEDEALKLFCLRAFRDDSPAEGYEELSRQFVAYASRLPLALTVLGSYIHGKPINEWKSALKNLKKFPKKEILENLRISFDSLDKNEKEMFLDIACFFVGEDVKFLRRVLERREFDPDSGITDLKNKSLITISGNKVWMHDLVQQLGQEIVKEEHKEPGRRSRIWLCEDLCNILSNDMGSEQVEGIVLNINSQEVHRSISSKSFLKMKKLRLLILSNLHCLQGQECLPNELRYLEWNRYPFESLPFSFHPDKLVELHLSYSNIKQLWNRKQPPLGMLKVINLSRSQNLIKTPDFSEIPNLEELILEGCTRLREVHQSIGVLERLVLLNLKDCKSLKELPSTISDLKSLKNLILHGCLGLHKLPERLGDLTCLEVLDLGRDVANEQPPTRPRDFLLRPWQLLPWKDPSPAALTLPSLSTLSSLRDLNLSYCKLRDGAIPNDLGCLLSLESLNLSGNDFKSLPTSIGQLSKVHRIGFRDCKRLQSLPDLPSSVTQLHCSGCKSLETIPGSICGLSNLWELELSNCSSVKSLPDLPTSVVNLHMEGCASLETLPNSISGLSQLVTLHLEDCSSVKSLPDLPTSVVNLHLKGCASLETLPNSISGLSELHTLELDGCSSVKSLPDLPTSVVFLYFDGCASLETLPNNIGALCELSGLHCGGCKSLETIPGSLCGLSNVYWVNLSNCSSLKSLPDLPTCTGLLQMNGCASLETLPNSISGLSGLQELELNDCKSLRTFPDLPGSFRTLPGLRGRLDSDCLSFTFLNCLNLTEKQDVLKKYLHSILKNKRQGLPSPPKLKALMSSTGGGIPGWFNYVSEGASLKVELSPYWFNDECLGFSICVVLGFHDSAAKRFSFSVEVKAWITRENPISVDLYCEGWLLKEGTCSYSDVISLNFFSVDESKSADWWNSLSHLEVSIIDFFDDGLPSPNARYTGLRIVYEQDVEELSGSSGTSSSPFHNVVSTRSHDDGCSCVSRVETRPNSRRWTRGILDCLDFVTGIGKECTNCLLPPSPCEEEHGDS